VWTTTIRRTSTTTRWTTDGAAADRPPHAVARLEAVVAGATTPEIEGVEVVRKAALSTTAVDVLEADGYLLGTPVDLGYVSGANATK
jgi:hypothetical protein